MEWKNEVKLSSGPNVCHFALSGKKLAAGASATSVQKRSWGAEAVALGWWQIVVEFEHERRMHTVFNRICPRVLRSPPLLENVYAKVAAC